MIKKFKIFEALDSLENLEDIERIDWNQYSYFRKKTPFKDIKNVKIYNLVYEDGTLVGFANKYLNKMFYSASNICKMIPFKLSDIENDEKYEIVPTDNVYFEYGNGRTIAFIYRTDDDYTTGDEYDVIVKNLEHLNIVKSGSKIQMALVNDTYKNIIIVSKYDKTNPIAIDRVFLKKQWETGIEHMKSVYFNDNLHLNQFLSLY